MPTLLASEDHIRNFIGIASDGSFTFALNDSIILNADLKFSNYASYYWYSEDYQYQINFGAYVYDGTQFQDSWKSNYANSYFSLKTTQVKGYYFRSAAGDLVYFGKVELLINRFIQCARNCTKCLSRSWPNKVRNLTVDYFYSHL